MHTYAESFDVKNFAGVIPLYLFIYLLYPAINNVKDCQVMGVQI